MGSEIFFLNGIGGTPLPRLLAPSGKKCFYLEEDGTPWRYAGVTAFKLCELWRSGIDITNFLKVYQGLGFNTLRVMLNKPEAVGIDPGWTNPSVVDSLAFAQDMERWGWRVEFVLCTGPGPVEWIPPYIEAWRELANVFVEGVNEPSAHDKPPTASLKSYVARAPLLASGDYDPPDPWYGNYQTYHSERVGDPYDTARKAKGVVDLYDGYNDGGSNVWRGTKAPIVGDEPGKPEDFHFTYDAMLSHFAIYSLACAGGTFHTVSGQFGQLPPEGDFLAAQQAAKGLWAFPVGLPDTAPFFHDHADEGVSGSLRTYRCGSYGVRVKVAEDQILIGV